MSFLFFSYRYNRLADFPPPTVYISRRCNSWVPFRVQKSAFLDTQIQMGVSQRVFIPSRASKYMLESKRESLRKCKKFEVGQLHFEVLATSKNTQYIYFIYTLWGTIVGGEVAQLQKFSFFWEFTSVYALHLA